MSGNIEFVDVCQDAPDSKIGILDMPTAKRRRPPNFEWIKIAEFESPEQINEKVELATWKKASSKYILEGHRVDYRCCKGLYRKQECPAGLYLLYHSESSKVSLFRKNTEHNHQNIMSSSRGLDSAVKKFIKDKFEEGITKPNALLACMNQHNIKPPPKTKLISFLQRLRHEKYENPNVSGTEIEDWCKTRETIPESKDQPFVLKYKICCNSDEEQDLKIVISTVRLLENLKKSDIIQIDATYKLIWQGFPVMIVGTSDKDRVFHPYGIAVCNGETSQDFSFVFDALHSYDPEWLPRFLLADASDAITNGFTEIFGTPAKRLMCFYHVLQNVEKYFKKLTEKRDLLKQDICALQICKDEETFTAASQLFIQKWQANDDEELRNLLVYFDAQWLRKLPNWYEGAAMGYPSTNHGIEAINAVLKKEHILREKLPVQQFFNHVLEIVFKWSEERNPESTNCKKYAEVPSITLALWTSAYNWAILNKKVLKEDQPYDCQVYYTCATAKDNSQQNVEICSEQLADFKAMYTKWETFDSFKENSNSIWAITMNTKNLEQSTCTCPYFMKTFNCKHVLGLKIRLQYVEVPNAAKQGSSGEKRKRGRPTKSKKALIVQ